MRTRTGRLRGRWLVGAILCLVVSGARPAFAGDAGVTADSPTISPELEASRFLPGSDAGAPGHFSNFSPASINYGDCANGIDIAITLDLANAPAGDEIQVWAGSGTADCTQVSARTGTASTSPNNFPGRCWPAAASDVFDPSKATSTGRLHVRDLVAYIGQDNPPATYAPTTSASVCTPYATNGPVQLNIYFIFAPAGSDNSAPVAVDGVSGLYSTVAALVGPFAPQSITVPNSGITADSLTVYWEPQSETTIAGYNVYDQDQGTTGANTGVTKDAAATTEMGVYCHPQIACEEQVGGGDDAGTTDGGATDGSTDASAGATDATVTDATTSQDATLMDAGAADTGRTTVACDGGRSDAWVAVDAAAYQGQSASSLAAMGCEFSGTVNVQMPSTGTTTCVSGVLDSLFQVDGGLGSVELTGGIDSGTTTVIDDTTDADVDGGTDGGTVVAATVDSGVASTTPGTIPETAGISVISNRYFAYFASGNTASSYTLNGLTTGHQYAIAVAAVDDYGNVGPVGNLGCSTPTPVNDFYMQYTDDGGTAGGGFCALGAVGAPTFGSVFGFGIAGTAVAFARRRRRSRRNQ